MAESTARIRPYDASDNKQVRFTIGKANMESLAVANRRAYVHPLVLSLWIALSSIFIQYMHWWPKSEHGLPGYFSPIPAFASIAVPLMSLVDWINRPYFEEHTQDALHRPDLVDIKTYYSRSPSSGLWILEYGKVFVGLIALDASQDSTSNAPVTAEEAKTILRNCKGTSAVANIRHFFVEEPYRRTKIQDDLLAHAVRHAFTSSKTVQSITAADSPLVPHVRVALRDAGFVLEENTEKVGIFGWKLGSRLLKRETWENTNQSKS